MTKNPKIITVIGARPQFIKAAVVSPVLSSFSQEVLIHTGQHFDTNMSDVFFEELAIPQPAYQLDINGTSHGDMTGRMLIEVEKILLKEKPDLVLVYGDTNSTLAGALAAAKLHIPLAHVEAGVRSFNRLMPEEINRVLTDKLSSYHFVTSDVAVENLKKEGCQDQHIYVVGDVMCDLALKISKNNKEKHEICNKVQDYILVTLHRSENTADKAHLSKIKELIEQLATLKPVIWLLHPRTKQVLNKWDLKIADNDNLIVMEPVGYKDMMNLVQHAAAVATDSGGLQKEAYYYRKPCITLRKETEWVELESFGWNTVVGEDLATKSVSEVVQRIAQFLDKDFQSMPYQPVYGEGDAADKIGRILKEILNTN